LLSDDGGGLFRKQGQPIVLQNIPFQLPIQHLRPYLSATQEVLLVGTLGHVNAMTNSVLATGTVLGCNRPKPGSASKPGATTNGESSF
ncbi:hypothetical protein, partial [Microseira wollei]|uniref:hypothetical protein n=1 Tax=Microseira wollei TaxID=467598 RepID=UPI001CFF020E